MKKIAGVILSIMLSAFAIAGLFWTFAQSVQAAESVNATEAVTDTLNVCSSGCPYTSIQAAIDDAFPGDIVWLGAETFTETFTVDKDLTVRGESGGGTIVQAAAAPGIAANRVATVTTGVNTTFRWLTLRYGVSAGDGGGIHNSGTLTVTFSKIYSNTAVNDGGGIYNDAYLTKSSSLFINASKVMSNTAQYGGGIYNYAYGPPNVGEVTIENAQIVNNSATNGGGVYSQGYLSGDAQLSIKNSTVENNHATSGSGGGIVNASWKATAFAWLDEITLSGNTSSLGGGGFYNQSYNEGHTTAYLIESNVISNTSSLSNGGGVYNYGTLESTAEVYIAFSTLYANTAANGGGALTQAAITSTATIDLYNSTISGNTAANGGGLMIYGASGVTATATLTHTTFSANEATNVSNGGSVHNQEGILNAFASILADSLSGVECKNFSGTINDIGYNMVDDDSCGFTGGSDPNLGVLQDNGGKTLTHAVLAGSPVIDAVPPGSCWGSVDQRGVSRPIGDGCEIGAYEGDYPEIFYYVYLPLVLK